MFQYEPYSVITCNKPSKILLTGLFYGDKRTMVEFISVTLSLGLRSLKQTHMFHLSKRLTPSKVSRPKRTTMDTFALL